MEFVEKFGIDPVLLLAQVVNFTILLILLRLFLYKPVLKMLEERKAKVAHSLKSAEEIEKRLAKSQSEQTKMIEEAKEEANKLISDAKKEAKELSEKTLAEAKARTEELLAKNEQRLELEKDAMMTEVKKEVAQLISAATAKVSAKSMTEGDNKALIDRTLKELNTE